MMLTTIGQSLGHVGHVAIIEIQAELVIGTVLNGHSTITTHTLS